MKKNQKKRLRQVYFNVPDAVLKSDIGFPPIHKVTLSDGREIVSKTSLEAGILK